MAKLVLKEFRCVVDTDESGSESPYFITFVGDITRRVDNARIQVTARGEWNDEVDKGELFVVNEVINTNGVPANPEPFSLNPAHTVVLVALIEEDKGFDITKFDHNKLESIRAPLGFKLLGMNNDGATQISGGAYGNFVDLRDLFEKKVKNVLATSARGDDDDLLGVRPTVLKQNFGKHPWLTGQTGNQPLLNFFGGNGHYRVRYIVQ